MMDALIVIIPARNEEQTIGEVIDGVLQFVDRTRVIVVDDASYDRTGDIAKGKGVKVIRHERARGYGGALKTGFREALIMGAEAIVTLDADLQHPPEYIPKFIEALKFADIVTGSRYHPLSPRWSEPPEDRMRINRYFTELLKEYLGFNITDAFCGFRAYRRRVLEELELEEDGYGMPIEMWVQLRVHNFNVKEIPIPLYYPSCERCFGGQLDDPEERLKYYIKVFEKALKKWTSTCYS